MSLALDGTAALYASSGASGQVTLTTTAAGMICVVVVSNGSTAQDQPTSVTASGLTFAPRTAIAGGTVENLSLWYASSSGPQTSLVITVTLPSSATFLTIHAFAVSGVGVTVDPNVSLPFAAASGNGTVSTTTPASFIIGCFRMVTQGNPLAGAGFTQILGSTGGGFALTEYQSVSSAQASLSVPTNGTDVDNGVIADALTEVSTTPPRLARIMAPQQRMAA